MTQSYSAGETFTATGARSETETLFGSTMALIAVTTVPVHTGRYLGRNLSGGWGLVFWIASLVCLLAMNVILRHSESSGSYTVGASVERTGVVVGLGGKLVDRFAAGQKQETGASPDDSRPPRRHPGRRNPFSNRAVTGAIGDISWQRWRDRRSKES